MPWYYPPSWFRKKEKIAPRVITQPEELPSYKVIPSKPLRQEPLDPAVGYMSRKLVPASRIVARPAPPKAWSPPRSTTQSFRYSATTRNTSSKPRHDDDTDGLALGVALGAAVGSLMSERSSESDTYATSSGDFSGGGSTTVIDDDDSSSSSSSSSDDS